MWPRYTYSRYRDRRTKSKFYIMFKWWVYRGELEICEPHPDLENKIS